MKIDLQLSILYFGFKLQVIIYFIITIVVILWSKRNVTFAMVDPIRIEKKLNLY